jgi:[ribosomal protein S18]-alanine N-acetyltransferase
VSEDNEQITGAVIINKTGMAGYIPENILVYIAVHKDYQRKRPWERIDAKNL